MSRNPLIPAKPAEITLDTLPQLFAHHRARFGGWSMSQTPPEQTSQQGGQTPPENQQPQRPDGISEDEWNALGDPGRNALVREREARQTAERALAATRARPTPPKQDPPKQDPPAGQQQKPEQSGQNGEVDVAAIVQQAVQAAIKPFQEREEQRDAESAAQRVQDAVLDAAKSRLHDATDALTGIDLTSVVNEQGQADTEKVKSALDDLITRKPHLAKPAQERVAPPGIGGGAPAGQTDAEKVKSVLADMQKATGVRLPASSNTN